MAKTRDELIQELLANPSRLKTKKPFTRGAERNDRISAEVGLRELARSLRCAPGIVVISSSRAVSKGA